MSGIEPLSGITGAGTIDRPYDQGNQIEQPSQTPVASNPRRQTGSSLPSSVAAILKKNTNGNGYASASGTASPNIQQSIEKEQVEQSTPTTTTTTTTTKPAPAAPSGYFDASKKKDRENEGQRYEERDVSPGEMRDGSHVQTSGDKGENYTPGKLNKFKDKFGFGHGR